MVGNYKIVVHTNQIQGDFARFAMINFEQKVQITQNKNFVKDTANIYIILLQIPT